MLDKLEHYGVRGIALQWFKSYLSCRKQFVQYNGYNSSSLDIICGVPQGSILGPPLFLVYINDLCTVSKVLGLILFADDTNIFYSHTDASYLMEVVNLELNKTPKVVSVGCVGLWKHNGVLSRLMEQNKTKYPLALSRVEPRVTKFDKVPMF